MFQIISADDILNTFEGRRYVGMVVPPSLAQPSCGSRVSANTYQGPKKIFGPCFLALYKSIIEHNKTLAKIDPSLSVDHIDDYYHHQASGLRHGGVG